MSTATQNSSTLKRLIVDLIDTESWSSMEADVKDEFVKCYNPENRHRRRQTWSEKNPEGRWRSFDYEEIAKRDKVNLDIFWLKDESLEDSDDLPDPDVLA